jgi:hypothetical protein
MPIVNSKYNEPPLERQIDAGVLLLAAVWLFLNHVTHVGLILEPDYRYAVLREFAPVAAIVLAFLLIFGVPGGWLLAGRMLAPLARITDATRNGCDRIALLPNPSFAIAWSERRPSPRSRFRSSSVSDSGSPRESADPLDPVELQDALFWPLGSAHEPFPEPAGGYAAVLTEWRRRRASSLSAKRTVNPLNAGSCSQDCSRFSLLTAVRTLPRVRRVTIHTLRPAGTLHNQLEEP